MNDYYLFKTGKDITAQRIAEADRARLARSARATESPRHALSRTRPWTEGRAALGMFFNRIALF